MEFLFAAVGLVIGLGFGFFTGTKRGADRERQLFKAEVGSAKSEAQRIIEEARNKAESVVKDAEIEARETQLEAKSNFEDEVKAERAELHDTEKQLRKKEDKLDKRAAQLEEREKDAKELERAAEREHKKARQKAEDANKKLDEARDKLQEVAKLSADEARQRLEEEMLGEAKLEAAKKIKTIEEEAKDEADKRARKIIAMTVQRYAGDYVVERCVTTVSLPSDDMKGRIIGREGRNIRAIEAATGVDLIVDDTPEAVVVSCFDKVRREIASISLRRLIEDGRIHPGRIEEVVGKVKKEVAQVIKEAGEQAAFELGLHGLHPEILKTIGRLRYRTSYGQNMWSHSIEVGWLCGMIAAELGLNVKEARRAGLLHDIGKAMDHEHEGSHALIGADFCKKHGEKPRVVNAIAAHHNEVPVESVYAYLVMASDALSGTRPGARREILETYIQRLEDIETISRSFPGVNKCYAFQAGRDVRVVVDHAKVSDEQAIVLSRDIAKRIESELTYPGQIKISVIRETRATEYAR